MKIAFFCLFALLSACSNFYIEQNSYDGKSSDYEKMGKRGADYGGKTSRLPDYGALEREPVHIVQRQPYEAWPYSRDLLGQPLRNLALLQGDEYLKGGFRKKALAQYEAARGEKLSKAETEALIMRLASTSLSLDNPEKALTIMSEYFRRTGVLVDKIDLRFALVFAYSYGHKNQVDQSLAWFSRVNRIAAGKGVLSDSAEAGARALLRALSTPAFETTADRWHTDIFVQTLIGEERMRRANRSYQEPMMRATLGRFWEGPYEGEQAGISLASGFGAGRPMGILLPLTGKFARLGKRTQNGIELAFLGQGEANAPKALVRDTAGDELQANAHFRELYSNEGANIFVGPLLSGVAVSVADLARQNDVSAIVFSKRNYFQTGNGIFRLGPTFESQAASIVEKSQKALGIVRYAVVYPQNELGTEFAAAFARQVAARQLNLVYETSYQTGDEEALVALAHEIERSGAQAVFLPDSLRVATKLYGNFSEGNRKRIRLLGSARWDNPKEIQNSRTVLDGIVFVSPFFVSSEREVVARFVNAYHTKYGEKPDFLAAQGFDAATLALAALQREGAQGISYSEALQSITSYDGLTGRISVRESGEIARQFAVVELKKGKLQELIPKAMLREAAPSYVYKGNEAVIADYASQENQYRQQAY